MLAAAAEANVLTDRGWRRRVPDAAALAVVLVATGLYFQLSRPMWFFGDDWEFLLRRGTIAGEDRGLWEPHNEHWSTGPILIYKALFALFGLGSYLPYAIPVLLAHAAVALLGYLILVRVGMSRWTALAVTTIVAFLGAGAENLLWAFQIGFVGSMAWGLAAVLLYDQYDTKGWRIWPVWATLAAGLTFSTVGVVMVLLTAVYAGLRRGVRNAGLVASVPAVVYLAWFLLVGRTGLGKGPSAPLPATLQGLPNYVWTGLSSAWEAVSGIPGAGAAIVLVLLGLLVLPGPGLRVQQLAWAGTIAAFALLTISGLSRVALGVDQAAASRYTYLVVIMMAPCLAVGVETVLRRLPQPRWFSAACGLGLLGLVVLNGIHQAVSFRAERASLNAATRDRVVASLDVAQSGARVLNPYPDGTYNPDLTLTDLLSERIRSRLPEAEPSEQSLLDASANLQVLVTTGEVAAPAPTTIRLSSGFHEAAPPGPGCHDLQADGPNPVIEVGTGNDGARITVTSPSPEITTFLKRGDGLTSDEVPWPIVPGTAQTVATSVADSTLVVRLSADGPVVLCV